MKSNAEIRALFKETKYRGTQGWMYRIDDSFKLFLSRRQRYGPVMACDWRLMTAKDGKILYRGMAIDRKYGDEDGLAEAMAHACRLSAAFLHDMAVRSSYGAISIRTQTGVPGVPEPETGNG